MILLDTHVWVWWIQNDLRIDIGPNVSILDAALATDVAVSAVSCWEVAVLHARKRLIFECSLDEWLDAALHQSGVSVVHLV